MWSKTPIIRFAERDIQVKNSVRKLIFYKCKEYSILVENYSSSPCSTILHFREMVDDIAEFVDDIAGKLIEVSSHTYKYIS